MKIEIQSHFHESISMFIRGTRFIAKDKFVQVSDKIPKGGKSFPGVLGGLPNFLGSNRSPI